MNNVEIEIHFHFQDTMRERSGAVTGITYSRDGSMHQSRLLEKEGKGSYHEVNHERGRSQLEIKEPGDGKSLNTENTEGHRVPHPKGIKLFSRDVRRKV